MLCDICHENESSITIQGNFDGHTHNTMHICTVCAAKYGLNVNDDEEGGMGGLTDFIHNMAEKMGLALDSPEGMALEELRGDSHMRCPDCGLTLEMLRKTGKLGCEKCYGVFWKVLQEVLIDMHRGTRHVGRRSKNIIRSGDDSVVNITLRVSQLQKDLDDAVKKERFEDAARLRDEINQLREKLDDVKKARLRSEDDAE